MAKARTRASRSSPCWPTHTDERTILQPLSRSVAKLAHLQTLTLTAAGAGQQQARFPERFIKFAGQGQTIGPALEAFHVKPPERAFGRRLGRFVIFPANKIAGTVHAPTLVTYVGHRPSPAETNRLEKPFIVSTNNIASFPLLPVLAHRCRSWHLKPCDARPLCSFPRLEIGNEETSLTFDSVS